MSQSLILPFLYAVITLMEKTQKYRIYPSKSQARVLNCWLFECRWLWNYLLEQRRNAWENEGKSLSYTQQCAEIGRLKQERPQLAQVYSQVLQNVAGRLDNAFQHFFRRIKQGEKPGYPRFKNSNRYHSLTYPQFGFGIKDGKLHLAKIGDIKIKLHRPLEGKAKTCTIVRKPTGKWFVCFSVKYEPKPLSKSERVVGIDMGIESFATLSTGEKIPNPHFFKAEEKALVKAQRKLSRLEEGTPAYEKARKVVARVHERIGNKRHDFIHQEARKLVDRFDIICVEDLKVKNMIQNGHLSKSIGEVAWADFIRELEVKAESAGRKFVRVKPNDTSQLCSRCHLLVPKDLSVRTHSCPHCGLQIDRDLNSAYNVLSLGLGLQSLGICPRSPRL